MGALTAVNVTSATLSWTALGGSNGYEVDAVEHAFIGGMTLRRRRRDSDSTSLTVLEVNPDTTDYFNVGSRWAGATIHRYAAQHQHLDEPDQFDGRERLGATIVAVHWPAFASGSSTGTVQGYESMPPRARTSSSMYPSTDTTAVAIACSTVSGVSTYHLLCSGRRRELGWICELYLRAQHDDECRRRAGIRQRRRGLHHEPDRFLDARSVLRAATKSVRLSTQFALA